MSEWPVYTVQQLVELGVLERPMDGNHGSIHPKTADFVELGIPFIMASDLKGGRVDLVNCAFISEKQASQLAKGFSKSGDVLLSHKATLGRTAIVQDIDFPYIMLTPQVTYYRIKDKQRLNNRFLKYYFNSRSFLEIFEAWAGGGSTRAYLGITAQLKLPIPMPRIEEQISIAEMVGPLDDKIELNRRMNETLEAMARAIFKDWFVDFGPTRAKIEGRAPYLAPDIWSLFPDRLDDEGRPEGWRGESLSKIVEIAPTEPMKKGELKPYLDMAALPTQGSSSDPAILREYSSGTRFRNGDTLLARITPCLENGKTAFVQNLPPDTVGWGSTEFIVMRSRPPVPKVVSYLIARDPTFRRHTIQSMTGTSGRQRANADAIAAYPVVLPSNEKLWDAITEVATPAFEKIAKNTEESLTLAATRDLLLPKLMSGEIRVKDAERLVGEVA